MRKMLALCCLPILASCAGEPIKENTTDTVAMVRTTTSSSNYSPQRQPPQYSRLTPSKMTPISSPNSSFPYKGTRDEEEYLSYSELHNIRRIYLSYLSCHIGAILCRLNVPGEELKDTQIIRSSFTNSSFKTIGGKKIVDFEVVKLRPNQSKDITFKIRMTFSGKQSNGKYLLETLHAFNKNIERRHTKVIVKDRSDQAWKLLVSGGLLAYKNVEKGSREQRKAPENEAEANKKYYSGSDTIRKSNVILRAIPLYSSAKPSQKMRRGTHYQYLSLPVRVKGALARSGKIRVQVTLKVRRTSACKSFGCGRRYITVDTYTEEATIHSRNQKTGTDTVFFNALITEGRRSLAGIFETTLDANPTRDIRVTIKILGISH